MIHHVNLSRIRVMNFYLAMSNVSTFLAKEDLETLKLKDQVAIFNEKYKAFDDAVVPLRKVVRRINSTSMDPNATTRSLVSGDIYGFTSPIR